MKKEFSKEWKASKQPRKQRKYVAKAPLHIKRRMLSVNLSKDLRAKQGIRNIEVRKDDKVKIMRGKFKGKTGKVLEVLTKMSKVIIKGINVKKQDGSQANVKMRPSNLQIIELNLEDKKRLKASSKTNKTETPKKEVKDVKENKTQKKTVKKTNKENKK